MARKIWNETKDANKAFNIIQDINCLEKYIFKGLAYSHKNDYLGAFQNVRVISIFA